jgi:hypothetical protein
MGSTGNENAARRGAALFGETKSEMHEHSTHLDHIEQRLLAYQPGYRTVEGTKFPAVDQAAS